MEPIFYVICFLAGALVARFAGTGAPSPARGGKTARAEDERLKNDIELIGQWGNLLRYDGRQQEESEE